MFNTCFLLTSSAAPDCVCTFKMGPAYFLLRTTRFTWGIFANWFKTWVIKQEVLCLSYNYRSLLESVSTQHTHSPDFRRCLTTICFWLPKKRVDCTKFTFKAYYLASKTEKFDHNQLTWSFKCWNLNALALSAWHWFQYLSLPSTPKSIWTHFVQISSFSFNFWAISGSSKAK